jgi:hypothetical protein
MRAPVVYAALVLAAIAASPAAAQDRLPLGTRVGNGPVSAPASPGSPIYDDGGRRDPFVSLLVTKKTSAQPAARVIPGLAGVSLADVAVKGIIHNGATVLAVLEGPGGKSFVAHAKDRLHDATVKAIDADGVVFVEQQVDVLGAVHTRDVRKSLRPIVEGDR